MNVTHALGLGTLALAATLVAAPASAQDKAPCPAGLICASAPQTLIDAMKRLSPKTPMTLDKDGLTHFTVTDATYKYGIYLNDCDGKTSCAAIDFSLNLEKASFVTPAYANDFNSRSRIAKAYVADDGTLQINYSVSTVGGITQANFKDLKAWWESQIQMYSEFYKEEVGDKK